MLPAQPPRERSPTFSVGRLRFGENRGGDCGDVGRNMVQLVARVTTVPVRDEKKLTIDDPELFDTPFLFMNGHNDFVFSEQDLEHSTDILRAWWIPLCIGLLHEPAFPIAWRRELSRVFPDREVEVLPYDHPIYRTFYRIERVRNLHENRDVRLEALFFRGRMVAVMCENGLCCAFAMDNRCNVGRGVSPEDGKKLALNIAIYAMTH